MDEQFDFRALLLKLQDCLSDNDRRRLHFIVGDTIPRHLRDDPSLGGTLSLLETLFDQAKISEQDFDYLIYAFREIHCYEAVKRLKEHQAAQHQRSQSGISTNNLTDLFKDNEMDKVSPMPPRANLIQSHTPPNHDSKSSQETLHVFEQPKMIQDKFPLKLSAPQSQNKCLQIDKAYLKQILKSRLTRSQLILLILNFIGIITFILLIVFYTKAKHSRADLFLVRIGAFYGNIGGGNEFNDALDCSLTFDDQIVAINAGWESTTLNYVTFSYSNGKSKQHGQENTGPSSFSSRFNLARGDTITGVTVYTGIRMIDNPFALNGSFLVVGLRFYSSKGVTSDLFGSSNGTQTDEIMPGSNIGYARGRSFGYIDGVQFIWYKKTPPTDTAVLSIY